MPLRTTPLIHNSMIPRILPLFLCLFIASCGSGEADSPAAAPVESTPSAADAAVEIKTKKARRAYTEEELNAPYSRVSPWRYIATSPECTSFKKIVGKSSLGRTVHNSGHAILVPEDMTFAVNKEWKGILEPGQEEVLDEFVGAHIIIGLKSAKSLEGIYEDHNGRTVAIERGENGELMCGGARLLGKEVETDGGLVIPVMGLVDNFDWRQ